MNEFKHWEKKASGWVFLSHASEDYEFVKVIRNYLEENGFSALMFYLKSLEGSGNESMIENLIFAEIKARNIFVLCKSDDAKKSKWVKKEVMELKRYNHKIFKTLDMNMLKYKKATALSVLDDLLNLSSLYFISHSSDENKIDKIYKALNSKGFRIFKNNPNETSRRSNKNEHFNEAIKQVSKNGTILIFLSKNVLKSKWFWREKDFALENQNKNSIIPIIIDDVNIHEFPAFAYSSNYINLNEFNLYKSRGEKNIVEFDRIIDTLDKDYNHDGIDILYNIKNKILHNNKFEDSYKKAKNDYIFDFFIEYLYIRINKIVHQKNINEKAFETPDTINVDYFEQEENYNNNE